MDKYALCAGNEHNEISHNRDLKAVFFIFDKEIKGVNQKEKIKENQLRDHLFSVVKPSLLAGSET